MLHWHPVSWWGNICVMQFFKWKGHHNIVYELLPHCDTYIIPNARPIIIATWLMLISGWGREYGASVFAPKGSYYHIYAYFPTNHLLGNPRWKTKYQWHSIFAYYQNVAVSVSFIVFPKEAGSKLVIDSSSLVTFQLPYIQDYKLLTLSWHTISAWNR
jgi:hypothetical protein